MLIMQNSNSLFLEKADILESVGELRLYGEDQVKRNPCCTELDLSICHLNTWYMAGAQYPFAQWMNVVASGSAGVERWGRALWIGAYNHPVRADAKVVVI